MRRPKRFQPVPVPMGAIPPVAWDQPAEVLFESAPRIGARLLMPTLGQPVEPHRNAPVEPWWRSVDSAGETARDEGRGDLPSAVPWPID